MAVDTPRGTPIDTTSDLRLDEEKLSQFLKDPHGELPPAFAYLFRAGSRMNVMTWTSGAMRDGALFCSLDDALRGQRIERAQLRWAAGQHVQK
jgi:hypothetical protein